MEKYKLYPYLLTGYDKIQFTSDGIRLLDFDGFSCFQYENDEDKEKLVRNLVLSLKNQVYKTSLANITGNLQFENPFRKIIDNKLYILKEYFNIFQMFSNLGRLKNNCFRCISGKLEKTMVEYIYSTNYIDQYIQLTNHLSNNISIPKFIEADEDYYIFQLPEKYIEIKLKNSKNITKIGKILDNEITEYGFLFFNKILNVGHVYMEGNKLLSLHPETTIKFENKTEVNNHLELIFGIDK